MTKKNEAAIESPPHVVFPSVKSWAVAWTKPRCERCLADFFESRGVPYFLPVVAKRKVYKSGAKAWSAPLFSNYVFFDQTVLERHLVFESRKVADILIPPDSNALNLELSQIALAITQDPTLKEARFGQTGRPVNITRGPMKGIAGELVRIGSQSHLILRVHFLGIAAELAIDEAYIELAL